MLRRSVSMFHVRMDDDLPQFACPCIRKNTSMVAENGSDHAVTHGGGGFLIVARPPRRSTLKMSHDGADTRRDPTIETTGAPTVSMAPDGG